MSLHKLLCGGFIESDFEGEYQVQEMIIKHQNSVGVGIMYNEFDAEREVNDFQSRLHITSEDHCQEHSTRNSKIHGINEKLNSDEKYSTMEVSYLENVEMEKCGALSNDSKYDTILNGSVVSTYHGQYIKEMWPLDGTLRCEEKYPDIFTPSKSTPYLERNGDCETMRQSHFNGSILSDEKYITDRLKNVYVDIDVDRVYSSEDNDTLSPASHLLHRTSSASELRFSINYNDISDKRRCSLDSRSKHRSRMYLKYYGTDFDNFTAACGFIPLNMIKDMQKRNRRRHSVHVMPISRQNFVLLSETPTRSHRSFSHHCKGDNSLVRKDNKVRICT